MKNKFFKKESENIIIDKGYNFIFGVGYFLTGFTWILIGTYLMPKIMDLSILYKEIVRFSMAFGISFGCIIIMSKSVEHFSKLFKSNNEKSNKGNKYR